MSPLLKRIIKIVVIVELVYLALINVALNLPLTQTLINHIKPDKFAVSWSSAWSLYPFRVHASDVTANGQARSQQWELQAPAASASISLLPLIWRSVSLSNVNVEDVVYHQRPRPRPDKDYEKTRTYFPPIDGRELEIQAPPLAPIKTGRKPWNISIDDIHAEGQHALWIYQMQARVDGILQADLGFQTRGGPFSLSKGLVDAQLESLTLNGDRQVIHDGHIRGSVEFLPFVPKDNKGLKALTFLNVDAEIQTNTESLAFLNIYLGNFDGMRVDGAGRINGRLKLREGELQSDNDLKVAASKLTLEMYDSRIAGDGNISITAPHDSEDTQLKIAFSSLEAFDTDTGLLLFTGDGLTIDALSNRFILPVADRTFKAERLAISIPRVEVPDLAAYQPYLPEQWAFSMHGGEGRLEGDAEMTPTGFRGNLRLSSDAADVGIREFRFSSNLDMAVKVDSPAIASSGIDVSGTYIHLNGAKLSTDDGAAQEDQKTWHARVNIDQGRLKLNLPESTADNASFRDLYRDLKGKAILPLLDSDDEEIKIRASISDLSWLSVLLKNRFDLAITGSGEVSSNLVLSSGWPAPGTDLVVHRQKLGIEVLDYAADGEGEVIFKIVKGGKNPDISLDVSLDNAMMKRKDEAEAFIENVVVKLNALARNMTFDGKGRDMDLHLQIPAAEIHDVSVYNQYLPPESPLVLNSGRAAINADIKLTPDTADGLVTFRTSNLTALIDDQQVTGELVADITLVDGVPENMDFDISGSSVSLNDVTVVGKKENHDDENWSARFELKKARAMWKKPVKLDVEADLQMTNSKPVVAVIANQRGKHGWLEKALTIDDVEGQAMMNMAENRIIVPYAYAASDKIDVGAKGIITADTRDGVLYVRFRKLDGVLKIIEGKRNLDVLKAREKFDTYNTTTRLPQITTTDTAEPGGKGQP